MPKWIVRDFWTGAFESIVEQAKELPASPIVVILFLVVALCFLPIVIFLIGIGLLIVCFVMIFSKPLRGILGFGIPVLFIFLVYLRLDKIEMIENQGKIDPLVVVCCVMVWLAPLMALARKPLYVLAAFASAGIAVTSFFIWPIPLLIPYERALESNGLPGALLILLLALLFCGIELILLLGLPVHLMIKAFNED
jgi:hypothetical protein